MAQVAARRRRSEWLMLAQVIAAGVNAGFSGDWRAIRALASELEIPMSAPRASGPRMGDLVGQLYAKLGTRYGRADSR